MRTRAAVPARGMFGNRETFRSGTAGAALYRSEQGSEEQHMRKTQNEIWNPFGRHLDGLSITERMDMERARAWAWYLNGGGGDPSYFDYPAYIRGIERQASRRER